MKKLNEEFKQKHLNALNALKELYKVWMELDTEEVQNYPDYLPSFDEFIMEFELIKPL